MQSKTVVIAWSSSDQILKTQTLLRKSVVMVADYYTDKVVIGLSSSPLAFVRLIDPHD